MIALPEFPQTRDLVLEDKGLLDSILKKYPSVLSEFTFTNLFAWRKAYRFLVSSIQNCVLIVSQKNDALCLFDPLGPGDKKKKAIEACFSTYPEKRLVRFVRLPDETVALFKGNDSYIVKEDRDNFDYVYLTKDLIDLKGTKFDGKRNFIKRFKSSTPYQYREVSGSDIKNCILFEEEWCLEKDCQRTEGLASERQALDEMLENFDALGIRGGMIEINGKVEAVTLGEALSMETFVIHIEKANGAFIGIYQMINQEFCQKAASGYKFVNREQDLGVPGLRQAKESYHPCSMVKKYTLSAA